MDFEYIINNLLDTIKTYDFFVDWNKVENNVKKIEKRLCILNYLIGKENFKGEFFGLLKEYPEVITVFPILIAVRDDEIKILNENVEVEDLDFKEKSNLSDKEIERYYEFFKKSGLEELLKNKKIKNLVDYVFGVEVGMDTNARKNRTGKIMENIVEKYIMENLANHKELEYIPQATKNKIKHKWRIDLILDKTNRKFDFALYNKNTKILYLIEVNFYSGGGSKLKSTAGEYETLNEFIHNNNKNVKFIWITDGKGWTTAKNPLNESFNSGVTILNLKMIKDGILKDIVLK
ncbi:type II restriction endonuclease [Methanothermococcus okinawensis]|uniref:Type-2 restriction enzyme n=1 Tax=Methanothermococcus okinawensis (strain DSM 14208 / JCM 11175 / IH1) TaxID=647113 RepID=F8ANQ0_METOI|nr:type II restriction endonuclease [Methanothermococcus okinawensis]AEH06248.1 Type II site-specific deoxyribonuclease [Methanothermococcus okinawensis IH1]